MAISLKDKIGTLSTDKIAKNRADDSRIDCQRKNTA
jgi:hypothetical protein